MRHFLINSSLSLAIGCTGLPLLGTAASAQDFELCIGRDGPRLRTVDRCDPDLESGYQRQYAIARPAMRGCTEGRASPALFRRAGAQFEVRGRTSDGDRTYITFSRQSGCPVLE